MSAGVVLVCRVAVLVVVHEVLADGGAGHRGDVLHRGGIGRGSGNDDRLVEHAVLGQGLADGRNRGGFLANGHIDADHVGLGLVHDGIDGDSGLSRLAVADDELTLATANGHHSVDGKKTRLDRLAHRLALHDARSLELNGTTVRSSDGAEAVDGLTERINDAAKHRVAHGDIHDSAGGTALVAFLDVLDVAKEDSADFVAV